MHVESHVTLSSLDGLSGMDPHTHPHLDTLPEVMGRQCPLCRHRTCDCVLGAGEGTEEGVSLGVDLDAAVCREGVPQEPAVLLENACVALPQSVEQARGALNIGE